MNSLTQSKDNFEVAALLCRNECTLSSSFDFAALVDHAFDQLSRRGSQRAEHFFLIANYIKHHQCLRLSAIVDRFPSFVENAVNDIVEATALVTLLQETLHHGSADTIALFTKSLSKLISTSCKVAVKHSGSAVGLSVLEVLGKSRLRSLLMPSAKAVYQACLQLVDRNDVDQNLVARVYALFVSVESAEVWSLQWLSTTEEAARVLALLGVRANPKHKATPTTSAVGQPLLPSLEAKKLRGAEKALHLLAAFRGLCRLLAQVTTNSATAIVEEVKFNCVLFFRCLCTAAPRARCH